ncbi:MAG: hypothetical protein ACE37H_02600 [Phycisphaeraceae bacterium]
MQTKRFIIALALLGLTACQGNTTGSQQGAKPLDSIDLTRLAFHHQAETRKQRRSSDDTFIPPGTPVAITGVCELARDEPLFRIEYPAEAAHAFPEKGRTFRAHLYTHPELTQMKQGQKYLVKGTIAGGQETMCYGAYFIEVQSYTAID